MLLAFCLLKKILQAKMPQSVLCVYACVCAKRGINSHNVYLIILNSRVSKQLFKDNTFQNRHICIHSGPLSQWFSMYFLGKRIFSYVTTIELSSSKLNIDILFYESYSHFVPIMSFMILFFSLRIESRITYCIQLSCFNLKFLTLFLLIITLTSLKNLFYFIKCFSIWVCLMSHHDLIQVMHSWLKNDKSDVSILGYQIWWEHYYQVLFLLFYTVLHMIFSSHTQTHTILKKNKRTGQSLLG